MNSMQFTSIESLFAFHLKPNGLNATGPILLDERTVTLPHPLSLCQFKHKFEIW